MCNWRPYWFVPSHIDIHLLKLKFMFTNKTRVLDKHSYACLGIKYLYVIDYWDVPQSLIKKLNLEMRVLHLFYAFLVLKDPLTPSGFLLVESSLWRLTWWRDETARSSISHGLVSKIIPNLPFPWIEWHNGK